MSRDRSATSRFSLRFSFSSSLSRLAWSTRSHRIASQLERDQSTVVVLRKLVDKFGDCVHLLHWVREYTSDPFYQYMLRQFGAL